MPDPQYDLNTKGLGRLATFAAETATGKYDANASQEGSLAKILKPVSGGIQTINVVQDYQWTLSLKKDWTEWEEVPYVRLKEYKCVDSSIKKQLGFYYQLSKDTAGATALGLTPSQTAANKIAGKFASETSIDVYADIWPKDNPTNFEYIFPYFQKTGMELNTEQWTNLGSLGDSLKDLAEGAAKIEGGDAAAALAKKFGQTMDVLQAGSQAILNYNYPTVSVTDRPRIFSSHNDRSITITFNLYNTVNPDDWQDNRNLTYLLMSQNLFNKRDLTTGVPPVFYDVYIPGQYYSYASCVTNLKVDYLGNQRLLYGDYIVPDAYEVSITLQELVKPSKNQFEAVQNGAARSYVAINNYRNVPSAAMNKGGDGAVAALANIFTKKTNTNEQGQSVTPSQVNGKPPSK